MKPAGSFFTCLITYRNIKRAPSSIKKTAGLLVIFFCITILLSAQTSGIGKNSVLPKMLGADISFLPELEAQGKKFYDNGVQKDGIQLLKDHGFNYIRLRIFNDPAADSGYSPKKGFCDLSHTREMASRIKKTGLHFLLDFHYSDNWADPGKQYKPAAWKQLNFQQLTRAVYEFTKNVLLDLKRHNLLPDMVQVGNEINHGILWPDGHINSPDTLAAFLKAGLKAVEEVDSSIVTMLHIALGGQNEESRSFLDKMIARGVEFDVIGESYYPRWHGTLEDLQKNLDDLATHYQRDIFVIEYSQNKQEVNDIAFNLPANRGKGTCIWEPLSWGETIVDKDGKTNDLVNLYLPLSKKYLVK